MKLLVFNFLELFDWNTKTTCLVGILLIEMSDVGYLSLLAKSLARDA